jgi:hypothetical protein
MPAILAQIRLLNGLVVMQSTHPSIGGKFRTAFLILIGLFVGTGGLAFGGPPARFVSRRSGGGGAFFGPSINPYNPDDVWVGSDMSDLFHSTDFGRTWDTMDFRLLGGGNQPGRMECTSNPLVRYALNGDVPARSVDGGVTWTNIPPDPWSHRAVHLAGSMRLDGDCHKSYVHQPGHPG